MIKTVRGISEMSRKIAAFAAMILLVFALFGCSDSEANGSNDNTSEAASEITERL
jgi:hypothetical protein